MTVFNKIIAFFLAVFSFFTTVFSGSRFKKEIDLDKFELVWSDEFDGDTLDSDKWYTIDYVRTRRGGYWSTDMLEVKDGNLTIYTKYLENGINEGDPSGWYSGALCTYGKHEQKYGYFETRCILPKGYGLWSAFWMNNIKMWETFEDSRLGAEIDIYESAYYGTDNPNQVSSAVHWGGYAEGLTSVSPKYTGIQPDDPYNSFNTYGLEWNEHEYIFYVNGKVYARLDRIVSAPSQQPEFMILSVEVSGSNGVAHDLGNGWAPGSMDDNGRDFVAEFVVDYVRAYQYK